MDRRRIRRLAFWMAITCLVPAAHADDSAVELARRRFATGQFLYAHGHYAEALVELERARTALPKPEFDYNIGLCLEKLNRRHEAADALERFVRARPDDPEAPRIWQQIAELRAQPTPPAPPPKLAAPAPPPKLAAPAPPPKLAAPAPRMTPAPAPAVSRPAVAPAARRAPLVERWWLWTTVSGLVVTGVAVGLGVGLSQRSTRYPATNPSDGRFGF